jgi:hypothetical protein
MAIKVVTRFIDKDTVFIRAYTYLSTTDVLDDPTAVTIDIYDPDGTKQVDAEAMTKSDTGIYDYYYNMGATPSSMAKGKWRGEVRAADGTGDSTVNSYGNFSFIVE